MINFLNSDSHFEIEKIAQSMRKTNPNLLIVKELGDIKIFFNDRVCSVYQFWAKPNSTGEIGSVVICGDDIKSVYQWLKSNDKFYGHKIGTVNYFADAIDYVDVCFE
jgi:hypothetical protein